MTSSKSWLAAAAAVAVVLLATYKMWPDEPVARSAAAPDPGSGSLTPVRPSTPPVRGRDRPRPVPQPEMPPIPADMLAGIYDEARSEGHPQPGEKAFRANIDAFMDYNRSFAEEQARTEGITVAEVAELTYFGFLAQRSQVWSEVEDLLGHELPEEKRIAGEELMHAMNKEFKQGMRKLVADKATEADRWELIQTTQDRYREQYFAITGMNAELLDDLLAGDLRRKYAPSVTPPPSADELGTNPDTPSSTPRPGSKPDGTGEPQE